MTLLFARTLMYSTACFAIAPSYSYWRRKVSQSWNEETDEVTDASKDFGETGNWDLETGDEEQLKFSN